MAILKKDPSFHILISLIQIWDAPASGNVMQVPSNCKQITEVESIEIEETYTKLINRATVKFPRGTIIRKTMTHAEDLALAVDNPLKVGISGSGVIEVTRKQSSVAATSDFNIGQRIRIYLGYTDDPAVADLAKASNLKRSVFNSVVARSRYEAAFDLTPEQKAMGAMSMAFDGYITKVSTDTPIVIECENVASILRQITCPNKSFSKCSVNTVLCPPGPEPDQQNNLNLLNETGLELHPQTKALNIQVGHCELTPEKTLADLIGEWKKFGVYTFVSMEFGKPMLRCARAYFTNAEEDSILKCLSQMGNPIPIRFDYHVAQSNLALSTVYKGYIAVDAQGVSAESGNNDSFIRVTICNNPDYKEDGSGGEKYRILNESDISKKAMKRGFHALSKSAKDKKNDLTLYAKIPYTAKKIPITRDELLEEAVKYMENYNFNGVEGTLTLFGDLKLRSGYLVELIDNRYPGKNGTYLVENVSTAFGTGGYRQTITLPYCIKRTGMPQLQTNG